MAEEKKTLYTEEGFKVLSDELDYLKNTKIQEVKEALKEARAFGDLSENSEYDEAKNEQAKVVSRIAELEELISNAQIISETEIQEDVINLGSVVQVHDFAFDEDIEYTSSARTRQIRCSAEYPTSARSAPQCSDTAQAMRCFSRLRTERRRSRFCPSTERTRPDRGRLPRGGILTGIMCVKSGKRDRLHFPHGQAALLPAPA